MPHPFKSLAEANEAFAAQEAEFAAQAKAVTTITAERDSAIVARDAFEADLITARASAASAIADRDTVKASLASVSAEYATYKDAEPDRINAEAARTLAASGHQPLAAVVDNAPNANGKPDLSKLTGLAKATAAHTRSLSTK